MQPCVAQSRVNALCTQRAEAARCDARPQMFGCRKKMSAIAILDHSGAEAVYDHMQALARQGRLAWLLHHGSTEGGAAEGVDAEASTSGAPSPQARCCPRPLCMRNAMASSLQPASSRALGAGACRHACA